MTIGSDYSATTGYFLRRFLFLTFGGMIILLSVVLAYAHGLISPRALGWALLAYVACFIIVFVVICRKARARCKRLAGPLAEVLSDAMREKHLRSIRFQQFGVFFFALTLIF